MRPFAPLVLALLLGCSSTPADPASRDGAVARRDATADASMPMPDGAPDRALDAGAVDGTAPDGDAQLPAACPFDGTEPQKKAVFTRHVEKPDRDRSIEDELLRLFEAAVPGSRIRVGLFTFSRTRMARGLVEAFERGVDVRVVVDEKNQKQADSGEWVYWGAVQRLHDELGPERVVLCNENTPPDGDACIGSGINHNKFFLLSELCDGSRNVVVQSSANLTNPQTRSHNNMAIIRDDPALFAAYESYWDDLWAQEQNLDYYTKADGDTGTKAYFFPRAASTDGRDPSTDTIHSILGNVSCDGGGSIRVAMAYWTMPRGYLVDDLAALRRAGCSVRVVVSRSASSDALQRHLRDSLPNADVRIEDGVHSKYLLIDARYYGSEEHRQIVWTGSHNYTGPALRRHDEALLRVEDASLYAAYLADWQGIWDTLGR